MSKLSGMATLLSITFGIMNAQDAMPNQLWYEQPARNWVEALPDWERPAWWNGIRRHRA